ncbi:MAG: NUDIX hydrolase [Chloroflexota bacterium]
MDKPSKVEIIEEVQDYKKAIFTVTKAKLRHENFDGTMTPEMTRLNLERGDAVAAIMHNPQDDTIMFVEQFRYPTYHKSNDGWILELPAGIVEAGEDPETTMHREIEEETGYAVEALHHIYTFFLSPGGSSERIFLYYGKLDSDKKVSSGGGLLREHEYIRTHTITVSDALKRMRAKEFVDAKTIIALQWLDVNRLRLSQF